MHEDVRPTMESKRILRFGEMLVGSGFPGAADLCQQMAAGFKISGEVAASGVFPHGRQEPTKTLEDVWREAPVTRQAIWGSLRPSADPVLDDELTSATALEKTAGWLRVPFSLDEAKARLGCFTIARRFGIN